MTFISSPDTAPSTTGLIGRCRVCGITWQIRGDSDKDGCPFCGAPAEAVSIISEAP